MSLDAQPVNLGMSFSLPVNLAKIGTGYLSENPVAGVLLSLLAFFVFIAVLAVPISALFGVELFPGLLPHARALQGSVNLSEVLEALTGSQTVQHFMDTPLEDFVRRILGESDGGTGRGLVTVGDALGKAATAAKPALTFLDYDNAFAAVQVPGQECRQRLMCHVHRELHHLPRLLQQAYSYIGPQMSHFKEYSRAITAGLAGKDCDTAIPGCPYSVPQMMSFVPFLKQATHTNHL